MSIKVSTQIEVDANAAYDCLLPIKSRNRYDKAYEQFCKWRETNGVEGINEDVLIAFFYNKVILLYNIVNINISNFISSLCYKYRKLRYYEKSSPAHESHKTSILYE